jgi:hypothetical protein
LHAKRHFVLGDPRLDLGIHLTLERGPVERADGIELLAPRVSTQARRVREVQHRIATAAEGHALVIGRQKTRAPQARIQWIRWTGRAAP